MLGHCRRLTECGTARGNLLRWGNEYRSAHHEHLSNASSEREVASQHERPRDHILGSVIAAYFLMRLDGAAQVAQIVLAASAVVAVMVATGQVLSARSATKQTLTYNYMERFNSPELLPFHQKTADLFRSRTPADEGERYADFLKWDQKDKLAVLVVPNFFEEVAGMYNHGLLDRNVAQGLLRRARSRPLGVRFVVDRALAPN
jgi:hypothetical protein